MQYTEEHLQKLVAVGCIRDLLSILKYGGEGGGYFASSRHIAEPV